LCCLALSCLVLSFSRMSSFSSRPVCLKVQVQVHVGSSCLVFCLVSSCFVLAGIALSRLILSCLIMSCGYNIMPCLVLSCLVSFRLIAPRLIFPCRVLFVLSFAVPCLVISCRLVSCLVLSSLFKQADLIVAILPWVNITRGFFMSWKTIR
jgi:hypothetical protein